MQLPSGGSNEAGKESPDKANSLRAVADSIACDVQLIVIGEDVAASADPGTPICSTKQPRPPLKRASRSDGESEFWQRLGLVDEEQNIRRLYTAAMLAELVGVPVSVVRRWNRRGLIQPVRESASGYPISIFKKSPQHGVWPSCWRPVFPPRPSNGSSQKLHDMFLE